MQIYTDSFNYYCKLHQSNRALPYLLMFHGFMGSGRAFQHLIGDLSAFCNPLTIDLAGHGKTESPESVSYYSAQRQLQQIGSILKRFQFENLWLYGYSMGGRLAFQMLAAYPELFSGVIVESSHCGIQSEKDRKERRVTEEKWASEIKQNFDGFIDKWMNLPLFKHTPVTYKGVYEEIMRTQNPEYICLNLQGFGSGVMPNVCHQISKTEVPLTFIAGEFDQKYVNRMQEIKQTCKAANLHIIENAGHRVHTDQPEKLVDCLRQTMSKSE